MRLPWEPDFERLVRERETGLRTLERVGLEPQASRIVSADEDPLRPSSPAFDCDFCERSFHSYPALLHHRCREEWR